MLGIFYSVLFTLAYIVYIFLVISHQLIYFHFAFYVVYSILKSRSYIFAIYSKDLCALLVLLSVRLFIATSASCWMLMFASFLAPYTTSPPHSSFINILANIHNSQNSELHGLESLEKHQHQYNIRGRWKKQRSNENLSTRFSQQAHTLKVTISLCVCYASASDDFRTHICCVWFCRRWLCFQLNDFE